MASVIDVPVGDDWIDINTASGIADGTALSIQNKGEYKFYLQESATEPVQDDEGKLISTIGLDYAAPNVTAGSLKVWARCVSPRGTVIGVQVSL